MQRNSPSWAPFWAPRSAAVHDPNESVTDIDALATTYTNGGIDVTYPRERMLPHPPSASMTLRWS